MLRPRDIGNYLRYRKVVLNPVQAVTARRRDPPGTLVPLDLRRGGKVCVRSGTSDIRIFKDVFVKDVYGLSEFERGQPTAQPFDCVVDIGGHIGLFSIRVSPLAKRVIACEPVPENAELFRRNVEATGCQNISLLDCAVSSSVGTTQVFTSSNPAGHSVLRSLAGSDAEAVSVKTRTLADLFDEHQVVRCDLLKIDCEGSEYDILLPTPEILDRVDRIAMEYHDAGADKPSYSGEELQQSLSAAGFTVRKQASANLPNHGLLYAWRLPHWSPAGAGPAAVAGTLR